LGCTPNTLPGTLREACGYRLGTPLGRICLLYAEGKKEQDLRSDFNCVVGYATLTHPTDKGASVSPEENKKKQKVRR